MIHRSYDIKPTKELLASRGLSEYGRVQQFVDAEVIRLMVPYTPMSNGVLFMSTKAVPKIGSGLIEQRTPYARYQYYGKLMVSPTTGSAWAKKGEKKVLTGVDLVYNKSKHPMAGPFWFKRMVADNKENILKGAKKIAGAK